jgi:hypothetical protein
LPVAAEPVPVASFGSSFADAFCQIGNCCEREGYAFVASTCKTTMKAYVDAIVNEELADPGVTFDDAAAGDCIEAYRKLVTGCTDRSLGDATETACQGIFRGTVPEGGACMVDAACAELPGAGYVTCDTGVCTHRVDDFNTTPRAKLGEPCSSSCEEDGNGFSCSGGGGGAGSGPPPGAGACYKNDGLYCTQAHVCAAVPKIGEPCRDGYVCETDSYCNGSVCVASIATGPCPGYDECLSTSYCDDTTRTCIPQKSNGSACNGDFECVSDQCEGDVCRDWTVANPSYCAGVVDD